MAFVAVAAILIWAGAHGGDRQGFYGAAGGWCAGAARLEVKWGFAVRETRAGESGWSRYQMGFWRDNEAAELVAGLEWERGRLQLRHRGDYVILW